MQSGVTGINAIRIYNPIKQQIDHDPDGKFEKMVPRACGFANRLSYPAAPYERLQNKVAV